MAPALAKALNRLSRDSLVDLATKWLSDGRTSTPYLVNNRRLFEADEEDYLYTPAQSIEELRTIYEKLRKDVNLGSKRDIVDRIVDGDWRRGLSLHQHATLDFAYLEQNDTALRWTALRLVSPGSPENSLSEDCDSQPPKKKRRISHGKDETRYPQISAQSFVSALKAEISPLVKAHYHLHKMTSPHNLHILRLHILPNSTFGGRRSNIPRRAKHATDAGRVMYIALPDSCPYVYVSLSGASGSSERGKGTRDSKGRVMAKVDMAAMKKTVMEAIPKALSRPQQRWALDSTKLNARSLRSILELRGNQKPGSGGGAYSKFAGKDGVIQINQIDVPAAQEEGRQRQSAVQRRFGSMEGQHHAALDRVHVKFNKAIQGDERIITEASGPETSDVAMTFTGTDVFRGVKQLAELGPNYVDLDKLPAWMTGELGLSSMTAFGALVVAQILIPGWRTE
ncbi:chromosome loss-related protein [Exophiala xenobiotica]|nr:chromosome loss-related protein [Exophiala xenobiotica]KAK5395039.1 chromosome loss-related protein [Exophiala xenobiotica]KAK5491548.1 chromosome loss-related protein [Exophiala xenobiotica]KAK5517015.1 chromosome loss-related protein [Exophiala xenobiotica]